MLTDLFYKTDMRTFITTDREQSSFLPLDIEDWLPDKHLARFIVNIVSEMDLSEIYNSYGSRGASPIDPKILLGILFYGYSTGVFSSRKLEEATYDSIAFRYIAGNLHPDHDTINSFRKRFMSRIEFHFSELLSIAVEMGVFKIGNVSFDGTRVAANASKHKAMSYGHAVKLEKQIQDEVKMLLDKAEQANKSDTKPVQQEFDIPDEIARRRRQLEAIKKAKSVIEERARERYEKEKQEYDRKMENRKRKEKETGKKPRGREPGAPDKKPKSKDQYNFTDPESNIMKTGNGFQQSYNAQAGVDHDSRLIVGATLSNNPNDQRGLIQTVDSIPKKIGKPVAALADAGYKSNSNILEMENRGIDPFIATGREAHNDFLNQFQESKLQTSEEKLTPIEKMAVKLKTKQGKEIYRHRKMTVEPVFGIIKQAMGFRRFSFRGEENVSKEWKLVSMAYNLRRLYVLNPGY